MKYGKFTDGGSVYEIHTPNTPSEWKNVLFNDSYYIEAGQTLQGQSMYMQGGTAHSYTEGYRHFYIYNHTTGKYSRILPYPLDKEPENFLCRHALGYTEIITAIDGIKVSIKLFVPTDGQFEVFRISIENQLLEDTDISFFTVIPFENQNIMGGECKYLDGFIYKYSFPYHVYYEDKDKAEKEKKYYFMLSDTDINSYDVSSRSFYGGDDTNRIPYALTQGRCSNINGEGDESFIAAAEHRFVIKVGDTVTFNIASGVMPGLDNIRSLKNNFDPDALFDDMQSAWNKRISRFMINSSDRDFDALINHWLKKQVTFLARLNRTSVYCPVRNQLQDALGYATIEPDEAFSLALKVVKQQRSDGFLQQWYMTDGSDPIKLCLLDHCDGGIWLIICLTYIIKQCGNDNYFYKTAPYSDSDEETVLEHLIKAAKYMLTQLGSHGLCLMKDGDWTDPINGAGRLGKGESVWATMALSYSLQLLDEVCRRLDIKFGIDFADAAMKLNQAINNNCWFEDRYAVGFDDNGKPFGISSDKEGSLFLNTQTWAIICGCAADERLEAVKKSIETLKTPFGYQLLAPAFSEWNDVWGRLSIKQKGTTENGSVYCHGSMFKAFADAIMGDKDNAYDTLRRTFPTNSENPPEISKQIPTFIPNYYFGLRESPHFGRSSMNYETGSAAWALLIAAEFLK